MLSVFSVLLLARGARGDAPRPLRILDEESTRGSSPRNLVHDGQRTFFLASGQELWVTEGSEETTRRVASLEARPGPGELPPDVGSLVPFDGGVFFITYHSAQEADVFFPTGQRLWQSDGTPAGTRLVIDSERDFIGQPKVVAGRLFFGHGNRLMVLRSRLAIPALVREFAETPVGLTAFGDRLIFSASLGGAGREPWVSDGTFSGTLLLRDIAPGSESSTPLWLTVAGDHVYFRATTSASGYEPWRTDGTPEGTRPLGNLAVAPGVGSNPALFTLVGDSVFFTADDGVHGAELWKVAIDEDVPSLVLDIREGDGSRPLYLVALGDRLVFFADDGTTGHEPWISDGTAAGTRLLLDIYPGAHFSRSGFTGLVIDDRLVFTASDPLHGTEIWQTDGTPDGTTLVRDLAPGVSSGASFGFSVVEAESELLFPANDGVHGVELFRADRALSTIELVRDIDTTRVGSVPRNLTRWRDEVWFSANAAAEGPGLYRTDGSEEGTRLVGRFDVDGSKQPVRLTSVANGLFFFVGSSLFVARDEGVERVVDLPCAVFEAVELGESLCFACGPFDDRTLWISDGTTAGTRTIPGTGGAPSGLRSLGARVIFQTDDGIHGRELWTTDGTAEGTELLVDASPGEPSGIYSRVIEHGDRHVFLTYSAGPGRTAALYSTDGTASGTAPVLPGADFGGLALEISFAGALWLSRGNEIYRHDGTAESIVTPFASFDLGFGFPHIRYFTVLGDRLFFAAYDDIGIGQLWSVEGATLDLQLLGEWQAAYLHPFWDEPGLRGLVAAGGRVVFSARTDSHGEELWSTDGTVEGTALVADFRTGPNGSGPTEFTELAGDVLFVVNADETGREIWTLPGPRPFLRGNANLDAQLDLSDAVLILARLFEGAPAPGCEDATDVNDDSIVNIADPVYLLRFLFLGASAPRAPYPACGFDSTADALDCGEPSCE